MGVVGRRREERMNDRGRGVKGELLFFPGISDAWVGLSTRNGSSALSATIPLSLATLEKF